MLMVSKAEVLSNQQSANEYIFLLLSDCDVKLMPVYQNKC